MFFNTLKIDGLNKGTISSLVSAGYDSIKKILTSPDSILCEFVIESDKCYPLNPPGTALDNLILNDSLKKNINNLEIPS